MQFSPEIYQGLIPAVFSPMFPNGSLNLDLIKPLVEYLLSEKVGGFYVCGSTGEGPSLTCEERQAVAQAYVESAAGRKPVIIQVGHDSLREAGRLAEHALSIGADALAAVPPVYYKSASLKGLMEGLKEISSAAPQLPLFYYHIPRLTGAEVDVVELLRLGQEQLPQLLGVKFSAPEVDVFQECVELFQGKFACFFGRDEMLLSGLMAGATAAVGSTYNFAASLYHRIFLAFQTGDMVTARKAQREAMDMVRILLKFRGQPAFKACMQLLGLECGPCRLPLESLSAAEFAELKAKLQALKYFREKETHPEN